MKLLTWNINHRTFNRKIPYHMAKAIASLAPDVIVLTEYVPGSSHQRFIEQLYSYGFTQHVMSKRVLKENQVFIAANTTLECGKILAPTNIEKSVLSNALHILLSQEGFDILGMRVPDFSNQPIITPTFKRQCWDWILKIAADNRNHPFVIMGDFNTDPGDSRAKCGDQLSKLVDEGWQHAVPKSGASYWAIKNGSERRLDHAFTSRHFDVLDAKYIIESGSYVFAGKKSEAMSDHAVLLIEINIKSDKQL
ncbi:MAG: endonuclease/exonuclease/phosphatase family protein [Methanosarcina sp.]